MSLETSDAPLIKQGWIRALSLFIVYFSAGAGAGMLLNSQNAWFLISLLLSLTLVFLFRKFIDRKSFESLGFDASSLFPQAISGFTLASFLVCTGTLIIYFLDGLEWIDIVTDTTHLLYSAGIMMMVSIAEEVVFRGYVLRNLMQSFNRWIALVVSSALFTLVHISNPSLEIIAMANTFLGGLLIGITFIYTRTLWLPVFFHFSWNFFQGPLLGFQVSGLAFPGVLIMNPGGNDWISGGEYGFEGSLVCSILLLAALAGWIVLDKMKPSHLPQS